MAAFTLTQTNRTNRAIAKKMGLGPLPNELWCSRMKYERNTDQILLMNQKQEVMTRCDAMRHDFTKGTSGVSQTNEQRQTWSNEEVKCLL